MTIWNVKQESAILLHNNETPERYLDKFLSNVKVAKQKECVIWLDDGTIMSELKITKGSNITWDTATSLDIEKAREVASEKMRVIVFIQYSVCQYDVLRREMGNNMSKGRYKYPTTVTSAYNLIL